MMYLKKTTFAELEVNSGFQLSPTSSQVYIKKQKTINGSIHFYALNIVTNKSKFFNPQKTVYPV
jgi:hypothetical protein